MPLCCSPPFLKVLYKKGGGDVIKMAQPNVTSGPATEKLSGPSVCIDPAPEPEPKGGEGISFGIQ